MTDFPGSISNIVHISRVTFHVINIKICVHHTFPILTNKKAFSIGVRNIEKYKILELSFMISLNTEHEAFHLFYFLQFLLIEISEYLFPSISPVVTPVRSVESRILTEYLPVSPAREFVLVTAITVQKSIIL